MRTKPITTNDIYFTRATCLWDLDQFIGEEGWDDEVLIVKIKYSSESIECKGKELPAILRSIGRDHADPRDFIESITLKQGESS